MNTEQLNAAKELEHSISMTKGILEQLDKHPEVKLWGIFYLYNGISEQRTGPCFEMPEVARVELVRHFKKLLASLEAEFAAL